MQTQKEKVGFEGGRTLKSMRLGVSSRLPLGFWQVQALGLEWQGEKRAEESWVRFPYMQRWWWCALIAKAE